MDDAANTNTTPAAVTTTTTTVTAPVVVPVQPESWEDKIWDDLSEAEQWVVAKLHAAGMIIADDVWPAFKASLAIFGSQVFPAVFAAVTANITDPELIGPAVGAAIVTTASTQGIVDAKTFIANAETAVANDPAVQAALTA